MEKMDLLIQIVKKKMNNCNVTPLIVADSYEDVDE